MGGGGRRGEPCLLHLQPLPKERKPLWQCRLERKRRSLGFALPYNREKITERKKKKERKEKAPHLSLADSLSLSLTSAFLLNALLMVHWLG